MDTSTGCDMDEDLELRRQRLVRRCRLWLYSGYGLILAGMAGLIWLPGQRQSAWVVILLGAAARVMHHLDHAALRTLWRLDQERRRQADRRGMDTGSTGASDARH